jgi:hypothetical protein
MRFIFTLFLTAQLVCGSTAFAQVEALVTREYSDSFSFLQSGAWGAHQYPDVPTYDTSYGQTCDYRYRHGISGTQLFTYEVVIAGLYQINSVMSFIKGAPLSWNLAQSNESPTFSPAVSQPSFCGLNPANVHIASIPHAATNDTGWLALPSFVGTFTAGQTTLTNADYVQILSNGVISKIPPGPGTCNITDFLDTTATAHLEGRWHLCPVSHSVVGDWDYLPGNIAGARGTPILQGKGFFKSNQQLTFRIINAPKNSTIYFAYSSAAANLPLYNGLFVPDPAQPFFGLIALPTDALGEITLPVPMGANIPPGITLYFQGWAVDPTSASGYVATNGLKVVSQ